MSTATIARGPRPRSGLYVTDSGTLFVPTEDMWLVYEASRQAGRAQSLSALARASQRREESVPPNQRAGRRPTVSNRLITSWRQEYRRRPWFDPWLLQGAPPEGITIATVNQIQRCRQAWDFVELCRRADISHTNTYDTLWMRQQKIPDVHWLLWLFGGPVPGGAFVVGAALHRLRSAMSPFQIAAAAGVDRGDVREWHRDERLAPAFKDAMVRAGHAGDRDGGQKSFVQRWPDLPSDLLARMWRYAAAARLKACCERAGLISTAYYKELQEAERCGVKDKVLDYLAHRGEFQRASGRGVDRRCGLVAERFFIASEAMLAFRTVAAEEMSRQRVWALMDLPGILHWFRDWATPQQRYGARTLLPLEQPPASPEPSEPAPATPAPTSATAPEPTPRRRRGRRPGSPNKGKEARDREIIAKRNAGESCEQLAEAYGLDRTTVWRIIDAAR
jgi:hypothetical protein